MDLLIFSELKQGKHKLYLWPFRESDGNQDSSTRSKFYMSEQWKDLEKRLKKYENGEITKIPWLDGFTFHQIETIHKVKH